jgi:hypothetical protein
MIAYTSWHWIVATGAILALIVLSQILIALGWAFIMRHRRRTGGN